MSRCRSFAVAILAIGAALPAVPASADAAGSTFGARDLRPGLKGRDVRVLQDFLTRVGLRTTVDGEYGMATMRRVKSWERKSRRRVDGRMPRSDARVLRRQVESGTMVHTPAAAPAPTPSVAPGEKAQLLPDGTALAPASAPPAVQAMIQAGNEIHDKPYVYGGGHASFVDDGYDCSGSMSYVLWKAGLLKQALDSTGFMSWGEPGAGTWVTTYANSGHSYMIIAGLRFDTSGRAEDDTRWDDEMRSASGYTERHPAGL